MKFSRWGLTSGLTYLSLFFLSFLYALYMLTFHTGNSELCGVLEIVLTLPWSLISIPLINATGYVEWYGKFADNHLLYGFLASLDLFPLALLNAVILYFVGQFMEELSRDKSKKS